MTRDTKIEILKVSGVIGICLLAFLAISYIFSMAVSYLIAYAGMKLTFNVMMGYQIIYTMVTLLVPFGLGAKAIKIIQKKDGSLPNLDFPKHRVLLLEGLGIGFAAMIICNFATSMFLNFLEDGGLEVEEFALDNPSTVLEFIIALAAEAIIPGMVEEFAFRGVVLQSLRKYGDWFAIIVSSFLFAVLHGNMTQAPFAFLLAVVIARLVIRTGSIWTGIAIHVLNNSYAVIMNSVFDNASNETVATVSVSITLLAMTYGIMGSLWMTGYHKKLLEPMKSYGGETYKDNRLYSENAFLFTIISPPMVLALIAMLYNLFDTIHWGG